MGRPENLVRSIYASPASAGCLRAGGKSIAKRGPPMPENDWALTGCEGRPRRIVNSLYLNPEENFSYNVRLKAKYERAAR